MPDIVRVPQLGTLRQDISFNPDYLRHPPHDGLLVATARDWQLDTLSMDFHHLVIIHAQYTKKDPCTFAQRSA